ncbi:putative expansin-B2 isoform X2 [Macadamia integrifolia]|uniref:putative expansin-B2 isoform X2 n=1 Tax=Macadamia integrifolia TaxID=60698 RepID=UPI001C4EA5B0|nr:putative expansin-B2 isoform X2 [Macadamia integrifolia]
MASTLVQASSFCFVLALLAIFSLLDYCSCWSSAGATWYGSATGAGSDEQSPFSSMVSAGGPSLFKSGKGCGACYQVKCTDNAACSGNPVTVVITDECPGCVSESVHFDMSGTSFGAMANSGQANQLRSAGQLQVQYQRVQCDYGGVNIAFHVDSGSNSYYFAVVIEFVDGDGDLNAVDLRQALDSDTWQSMQHSWGAVWKLDNGSAMKAPFSIRLTTLESGKVLVITDAIPAGWTAGTTYQSAVNYQV